LISYNFILKKIDEWSKLVLKSQNDKYLEM
jgi:hypothetical protein